MRGISPAPPTPHPWTCANATAAARGLSPKGRGRLRAPPRRERRDVAIGEAARRGRGVGRAAPDPPSRIRLSMTLRIAGTIRDTSPLARPPATAGPSGCVRRHVRLVEVEVLDLVGRCRWAAPTSFCEVRRFTGLANCCHRVVVGYAEVAAPLTALGSPPARFTWTAETQASSDARKLASPRRRCCAPSTRPAVPSRRRTQVTSPSRRCY